MNGNNLRKHGRKGPKAKTGCRTCKIRRIKCDEGRPACQRCVTTGRTCDGYGILDNSSNRPCSGPVRSLVSAPCNTVSDHDRAGFQWFSARTRYKMPGTFASGFWESVVLQASWREPAVLQAVLALSAAHKRHVLDASGPDSRQGLPDGQERVLLRHYSSAIKLLQPHLSVKSKENLRVALISCIVFTCLEFLRQHYKTGHVLLQHGLKLLNSIQPQFHGDLGDAILLKHQPESINDTLIEEMARLDVQAALLGYGSRQVCVIVPSPSFNDDPKVFRSVRMARQRLDTLLDAIHRLQHQSLATECVASQLRIRTGLSSWLVTYKATLSNPEKQLDPREVIAYRLLLIYHNMTIIMVATCLPFTEESMFDLYTPEFTTLISQCTDLISFASPEAVSNAFAGVCKARPAFIADMGLVAPLYYMALKCRVPRLRHKALALLLSTEYREGIWNGRIAARVAMEVMKIEHGEACAGFSVLDNGGDNSIRLPNSSRVSNVQVQLANGFSERLSLTCQRKLEDGSWEVIERVCHLS